MASDLLREMELAYGESEPDIDISEKMIPVKKIFQCTSFKTNLYDELEVCVDTLGGGRMKRS